MFKNSSGGTSKPEEAIFPLITIDPATKIWKCVGTGFFIQPMGGFVTAKHVFQNPDGKLLPTLYGIQTTVNNEIHVRPAKRTSLSQSSDIAVGMLGEAKYSNGVPARTQSTVHFTLDLNELKISDNVRTYAFPKTIRNEISEQLTEFTFKGKWSMGDVIDFHPEGATLLKGPCYQTNMFFDHGASGGPVLRNNLVVGINSTSMEVQEGDPVSFITPISELLPIQVIEKGKPISISELIASGHIQAKK